LRQAGADLRSRRRLIRYLVQADTKKKGADTLLGNVWWILDPLLQMLVYVILVAVIFQRSEADYPLFIFAAILPWKWFTSSVNDAIGSVVSQERLIKQIHFPKIVLPTATISGRDRALRLRAGPAGRPPPSSSFPTGSPRTSSSSP
jgi:ABC-type polysaccharide/polyol phosphate export permease